LCPESLHGRQCKRQQKGKTKKRTHRYRDSSTEQPVWLLSLQGSRGGCDMHGRGEWMRTRDETGSSTEANHRRMQCFPHYVLNHLGVRLVPLAADRLAGLRRDEAHRCCPECDLTVCRLDAEAAHWSRRGGRMFLRDYHQVR
jgi:hypothetical protein